MTARLPILVLLAALAWPPLAARARGLAIVLNSGEASISLIDVQTGAEIKRVPVLREPHHLALSPDGHELLVGDTGANELLFLDPATGDIRRRLAVSDPYQLGFSPNGRWLTVTGLARNQVDIYDAATLKLARRLPLASMPSHLAYAPDSSMVYVTLQGTDRLVAISLARLEPVWTVPVGRTPAGVLWWHDALLVGIMGSDYVAEVDPVDGRVVRRIQTGRGAHNLFVSPDAKTVYVSNRVDGTIVALDASSLKPTRTYSVPGGPDCVEFGPDGRMWITRRWAQKVAVLDLGTGQYQTIDVGRSPHGIFLNTHGE